MSRTKRWYNRKWYINHYKLRWSRNMHYKRICMGNHCDVCGDGNPKGRHHNKAQYALKFDDNFLSISV